MEHGTCRILLSDALLFFFFFCFCYCFCFFFGYTIKFSTLKRRLFCCLSKMNLGWWKFSFFRKKKKKNSCIYHGILLYIHTYIYIYKDLYIHIHCYIHELYFVFNPFPGPLSSLFDCHPILVMRVCIKLGIKLLPLVGSFSLSHYHHCSIVTLFLVLRVCIKLGIKLLPSVASFSFVRLFVHSIVVSF